MTHGHLLINNEFSIKYLNMNEISPVRTASNVFAWIGFGISLAVFLMVWGVNIIVFTTPNFGTMFASLYMMLFLAGSVLGVLGLVFSIVGLIISYRKYLPKWPGVIGITLCCLSIVSVFAPFVMAVNKSETMELKLPETVTDTEAESIKDDIILKVLKNHTVECYNNKNGEDRNPNVIKIDDNFNDELSFWLRGINVDDTGENFAIEADKETGYDEIVIVLDALKNLGITKFRIKSADKPSIR